MATVSSDQRSPRAEAPASTGSPAISIRNVSKTFRVPKLQYSTLKERALHPFRANVVQELPAVRDVSLDVATGEFCGIVGRNGSGKSTLLKCLAGTYGIDDAHGSELYVRGRVSPFIELGVGFNLELTATDNVLINAIMLGLTLKQARARFDDIIAFAELEEFLDLKLKNYSSGMYVRLAFSIAVQVDADVLLIDEVLAVGDAAFQQKCFDQFHLLKERGKTVVFVTHDMSLVERFCDRAILLERGKVVADGDPHRVARAYHELNFGRTGGAGIEGEEERYGDREAEVLDAWVENDAGERTIDQMQSESFTLCMLVVFHERLEDPVFGYRIRDEWGQVAVAARTDWAHGPSGTFAPGERRLVRMRLENLLAPGRYTYTPMVMRAGVGEDALDIRERFAGLLVHGSRGTGGLVDLPYELEIRPT